MFIAEVSEAVGPAIGGQMIIMFLLFLGMWFILIAPQRKRQKQHDEMVKNLKKGDKILMASGIFGEICDVKPDRFRVKVDEHTMLEVHRSCISAKV